ncbi:hypothetical protein [Halomonas maura]|uniref:hypothetical protein n=1 Tax=Halomonas maura TaxID=117606 RepID=UPI0025B3BEF3|nr:hypothetical protein [Halomonas maura]MDN3554783.1 hypothetical protein [Halomonas maura]
MKQAPDAEMRDRKNKKREWISPELTSMSIEQTLSGSMNVPAENMSGRSNVPGS